jgi:hypothetical protein
MKNLIKTLVNWILLMNVFINFFIPLVWGVSIYLTSQIFISWWNEKLHIKLEQLASYPWNQLSNFYGDYMPITWLLGIIFFVLSSTGWGGYDNFGDGGGE